MDHPKTDDTLVLQKKKLKDDSIASINLSNLRVLDVSDNSVSSVGAILLARSLMSCCSLQRLFLDGNRIEDSGCSALLSACELHASMRVLSMANNSITGAGLQVLAKKSKGIGLQRLFLGNNKIGKDGMAFLAQYLESNTTLMALDVKNNGFGDSKLHAVLALSFGTDGMDAFFRALQVNQTLLVLDMSGNDLSKVALKAFSDALSSNKVLCKVLLHGTHVDLLDLRKNYTVTSLGPQSGSNEAYLNRNVASKNAFLEELKNHTAKAKSYWDRGVDILACGDDIFKRMSIDTARLLLSRPVVGNVMFSRKEFFDAILSQPVDTQGLLAKETWCLHEACWIGHVEACRVLLKAGADANRKNAQQKSCVHIAVERGFDQVLETLLLWGHADPNTLCYGLSPLLLAAKNGHASMVKLLARKYPPMLNGRSPAPKARHALHVAARYGHAHVCQLLLTELSVPVDVESGDGKLAIHVAGTPQVVDVLVLSGGANVNASTKDGKSPIYCALTEETVANLDVITQLLERGSVASGCESITSLDLRNQCLDKLPVWIGKVLPNLETLQVSEGNPLTSLPRGVVEGGDESILWYLKDMSSGKKALWEGFKVMVLGKEGVGKTHLFHLASGQEYPRNRSTDGIDIHTLLLNKTIPVTWFDFGGQEVFYPTHELFLTGHCVYMIVFRVDDPEFSKRVSYWLRVVKTFAYDMAKVVIVGTHVDMLISPEEELSQIQHELKEILSSSDVCRLMFLSCVSDESAGEEVVKALLGAAKMGRLGEKEVPRTYMAVRDWIRDQRSKHVSYVPWDQFVSNFAGFDDFLLERACTFLHDMGELFLAQMYSEDNKKMHLVCVDVQWLARLFSVIITFRHQWVKEGVLKRDVLSHVWRDFGITDASTITSVMGLFEKFHVVFPQREDGAWVIPSMLPEAEPPHLYDNMSVSMMRRYTLDVLPSGVMGQLMTRASEWHDVVLTYVWRYGMIIDDGPSRAVVRAVDGCQLQVAVGDTMGESVEEGQAASRSNLMRRLDEQLHEVVGFVFRKMTDLPMKVEIRCPHCGEHWLPFEKVASLVMAGETTFTCPSDEELPLMTLGEDLSMGYVRLITEHEISLDPNPLAKGGFGQIYRGNLMRHRRRQKVVVKELLSSSENQSFFVDFRKEVSLMSQLEHSNVVALYGVMFSPLRMVLEFCAEGDLMSALRKGRVHQEALRTRIALDIARGMNYLHSLQPPLAHRDLRSPNVFLTSLNSDAICAKVGDFGLATFVGARLQQELFTWQWMAPEAFLGQNYTERCDLYSYGIVMWEIWTGTGEIPFDAIAAENKKRNNRDWMNQIIHSDLRPVIGNDFPPLIARMIAELWRKDPSERPDFAHCVHELMTGEGDARTSVATASAARSPRSSQTRRGVVSRFFRKHEEVFWSETKEYPFENGITCYCMSDHLWIGGKHLYALDGAYQVVSEHTNVFATCLCASVEGNIWVGNGSGCIWAVGVSDPAQVHECEVKCMARTMDGLIVSGDGSGQLALCDSDGSVTNTLQLAKLSIECMCPSPSERNTLWVGCGRRVFRVVARNGKLLAAKPSYFCDGPVEDVKVVHGTWLWVACNGSVSVWNTARNVCTRKIQSVMIGHIEKLTLSNDERRVWSAGKDDLCVWDPKQGVPLKMEMNEKQEQPIFICADGNNVVVGFERQIKVYL